MSGEKIEAVTTHIPVINIKGADIEETRDIPLTNRVKIEASDGNAYTGDLIKWTKKSIKIRQDDGTAVRFRTD